MRAHDSSTGGTCWLLRVVDNIPHTPREIILSRRPDSPVSQPASHLRERTNRSIERMIFFKPKEVAVGACSLLLVVGIACFRPASAFTAAVRPTALLSATHPASFFSSRPAAARLCRHRSAAECCDVLPANNMVMPAAAAGTGRNDPSAEEDNKAVVAPGRAKKVMCLGVFWVVSVWCAIYCVPKRVEVHVSLRANERLFDLLRSQAAVQLAVQRVEPSEQLLLLSIAPPAHLDRDSIKR